MVRAVPAVSLPWWSFIAHYDDAPDIVSSGSTRRREPDREHSSFEIRVRDLDPPHFLPQLFRICEAQLKPSELVARREMSVIG